MNDVEKIVKAYFEINNRQINDASSRLLFEKIVKYLEKQLAIQWKEKVMIFTLKNEEKNLRTPKTILNEFTIIYWWYVSLFIAIYFILWLYPSCLSPQAATFLWTFHGERTSRIVFFIPSNTVCAVDHFECGRHIVPQYPYIVHRVIQSVWSR